MDPIVVGVAAGAGGVLIGVLLGAIGTFFRMRHAKATVTAEATRKLEEDEKELRRKAKQFEIEIREKALKTQEELEKEVEKRRAEYDRLEKKVQARESTLDRKFEAVDKRERTLKDGERTLETKQKTLDKKIGDIDAKYEELRKKCEEVSGMTAEQVKQMLLESVEKEARLEAAALIKRIETETKEIADKKARQILVLAIEKLANQTVTESTVSVVQLPGDDMKGRIIGREGRNIRALEAATGCNIIVDDTPEAIVISCFDPFRREVARLALGKLIGDGRIHPGRIEEVVARATKDLTDQTVEAAEQVCFDLGIHDIHPEVLRLLGRLKYRTSYGQNCLMHSQEVAYLAGMMASELNIDPKAAKRAGLLHDLGKAVSHESEGPHALIGAELLKKYHEKPAIIHAAAAHHGEEEPKTLIAVLIQAADTLSAARPGARRETLETYVKRLESLEGIANSFDGVERSFAIQAGRELRIAVDPGRLGDNECAALARDIAKRVEQEMQYPGQIKITVLRELRVTDYAK
ncbi:MAG: ribonuclease Y [Candidatus Sumerlaeota bacterium]|nr:ribonuclease Y [Candidatus Sumerlaeota bacterium]